MRNMLSKMWWALLLRGLVGIAFGILAFTQPGLTLASLVLLFGWIAILGGVFESIGAIAARGASDEWWVMLLQGLVGILIGVLTFRFPDVTAVALLFFIAIWALTTGVLQIVAAVRLRKEIKGEVWLILSGFASVALALLLMANPAVGALGLILYIGATALISGVVFVLLALRLRKPLARASA